MSLLLRLPPWLATALLGGAGGLALVLAVLLLRPLLGPGLAAVMLYVLLAPLVEALLRRGLGRTPAIVLILALTTAGLVWGLAALGPALGEQFSGFIQALPATWARLQGILESVDASLHRSLGVHLPVAALMDGLRTWLEGHARALLARGSGLAAELLLWALLAPLITFFLLRDYRRARNALLDRLPNGAFEDVLRIYHRVGSRLEGYVRGVMIQSAVVALIVGTGLALVGLPLAPVLGLLAGLLNLVPYLGPLLGALPPLLVALSVGLDGAGLGAVLAVLVTAQLVDNLVVVPVVLARAADLHPLIALSGVIVGGQLGGPLGMILALPLLASARICLAGVHHVLARRRAQVVQAPADMAGTSHSRPP